jgi:hypothetical protein
LDVFLDQVSPTEWDIVTIGALSAAGTLVRSSCSIDWLS